MERQGGPLPYLLGRHGLPGALPLGVSAGAGGAGLHEGGLKARDAAERSRWVARFVKLLKDAAVPAWREAQSTREPDQAVALLVTAHFHLKQ